MKHIVKISILLICFLVPFSIDAETNTLFEKGNDYYAKGKYKEAIEAYQNILKEGESAKLYYNLGNACYKDGQNTQAILNYERALLLNPSYSDAKANLKLAQQQVVDKIEPVDQFFLAAWRNSIQYMMSVDQWGKVGITFFLLFITFLLFFFFTKKVGLKKISFFMGITFFLLVLIANSFAYRLNQKLTDRKSAIVITPTITVRSAPDKAGTELFILHEGTKIELKRVAADWCEIRLGNGNVGWVPIKTFEKI